VVAVPKALFVDGHSLAYRAFFALPDTLATAEGLPTNAVLGFAQMLLRIIEEEKPDYVAVAFDKGRPEFRVEEYAAYKAQRKPTPDKLRPQFGLIKDFLKTIRAAVVEVEGYEGDDILAALTDLARREGVEALLVTGDRDTLQLVGPGVKAVITLRGISETAVFDAEAVREKYGVEPARLPDLKGLVGDPSDNLPGVPGVGPKTAADLLGRFGDLETLLARLEEVTPERLRRALELHADDARLCRSVATIRHDVPFETPPSLEDFRYRGWDQDRLAEFLRKMEFRSLLRRLGLAEKAAGQGTLFPDADAGPERGMSLVQARRMAVTRDELVQVASELARAPRLALAAALDGERPLDAGLAGVAISADGSGETVFVPVVGGRPSAVQAGGAVPARGAVQVPAAAAAGPVSFETFWEVLGGLLAAAEPVKVMHSAKPFRVWLRAHGADLGGLHLDTELAAYLLDPSRLSYRLEALAREFAGEDVLLPDSPPEGWTPAAPGLDWAAERLCLEADITRAIANPLTAQLSDKDLDALLEEVEMPLAEVLVGLEVVGVGVNAAALREMSEELGRRIEELTAEVYALAGEEFNINSPRQLGEVLFGKLKLPTGRKTATGAYSTSAEVLEELAVSHEIVAKILEHRHLVKLKGTYTDGMAPLINPVTGRLHTVFKQTVTATGRLSSTEPNLQNIPVREEIGRRIRRVFVAPPGAVLLAGDYSQIELRVMAHLSGDENLVDAFRRGEDIHQRTASEVFGVPMEAVTPELRSRAKAVNFGIIYGITDYGLARGVGVSREEAAAYIEQYLDRYRGVRAFVERTLAEARSRGYVTTLLNRRRYLPDLHSANRVQRQFAERAARNTPIQGTAADIIKMAMVRLAREMEDRGLKSRMILQVHDELLFEVPEEEVEVMAGLVRSRMEGVMTLDVPLKVDLKTGPNWYEMRKLAG
jgi:DNA polymerase-1